MAACLTWPNRILFPKKPFSLYTPKPIHVIDCKEPISRGPLESRKPLSAAATYPTSCSCLGLMAITKQMNCHKSLGDTLKMSFSEDVQDGTGTYCIRNMQPTNELQTFDRTSAASSEDSYMNQRDAFEM